MDIVTHPQPRKLFLAFLFEFNQFPLNFKTFNLLNFFTFFKNYPS